MESVVYEKVLEKEIGSARIQDLFKCSQDGIQKIYKGNSMDTEILLRWCKLLKYNFFWIYVQDPILFPLHTTMNSKSKNADSPVFRKNIYSKEIIECILEVLDKKQKIKSQIIEEYRIPRAILYK
ncbi:transposase [Chryseobacterium viscerum]|uniref:Transposase n=1 Tax=Chryseobacterium viscerum TaxID=1037377 RepID=A0A5N4BMJ4_9FLAO|nr:transposase [Chryseobacterium viscerum]KAB1229649.1 transposase [Chryseobacterium viscerum]